MLRIVSPGRFDVAAFSPETDAWRIDNNSVGRFVPSTAADRSWYVRLDEIGSTAIRSLAQPMLATKNGGPISTIAVPMSKDDLTPEHAMIALHFIAERHDGTVLPQPIAGRVLLSARGQSIAARIARQIGVVLTPETSLQ